MKFSNIVERIIRRLNHVNMRELPDGSWELYDKNTGKLIEIVPREDVDKALKRHRFRKSQKKRKKNAQW